MMKKTLILAIFFALISTGNIFANKKDINIKMYLLRKGSSVKIVLISTGTKMPKFLHIERKSSAPLSVYRKIVDLTDSQLSELLKNGKIILKDNYPESRQLTSLYRITYFTSDGVLSTPPPIFLAKSKYDEIVTYGDHEKDASMFVTEEEKYIPTYEEFNFNFSVARSKTTVLVTIGGGKAASGDWYIERKSSKPLASFRRIKTITKEDKKLVFAGDHVFVDKYPESRKLDSYYRLIIIDKDGNQLELPSVFLDGDANGNQ